MLLMVWFNWLGSAISGLFHFYWWLAVPPLIFLGFVLFSNWRMEQHARDIGLRPNRINQRMIGPNIMLVVWNGLLNGAIFVAFWLLSGLGKLFK
jgi:hypothetical protein